MKHSKLIGSALVTAAFLAVTVLATQAQPRKARTAGARLPAAFTGVWKIDPMHSTIGFDVRHMGLNDVAGTFDDFEGTIKAYAYDVGKSSVEFKAKTASINTRVAPRDKHLRSADFFDVAKYPDLTFKSTRVVRTAEGFRAIGTLTMHGKSRMVVIPFKLAGPTKDPMGSVRIGIQGDLQLNRKDYGIKYHHLLENGALAISDIVNVHLDLEAIKQGTGPKKSG